MKYCSGRGCVGNPTQYFIKSFFENVNIVPAAVVWEIPHNILLKVSLKLRTFKTLLFIKVYI